MPHRVRIPQPFYFGVYEVTQREWEDVTGSQPSAFSHDGDRKEFVEDMDTSRFPVERVSLDDAVEFCKKLSMREGKTYRLPTEAEWEYACRAGTTTAFNFGNVLNGDKANVNGSEPFGTKIKGPFLARTCRVGSYQANAFGLFDMCGNVWELCQDWYSDDFYSRSPTDDPVNTTLGRYNVTRGGSWTGLSWFAYSSGRSGFMANNQSRR